MANSRQYGVYGLLRKSIGSVVYSKSKDGKGKTIQVVRTKPTTVDNPNTVGQILQRCKIKPATRFYNAMQDILDHSWEGVPYMQTSRQYFMSKALKLSGPYIPKSVTDVIPADYPVSEGSIPPLLASPLAAVSGTDIASAALTAENVALLIDAGVQQGAQLTIIAWYKTASGAYDFAYGRIINEVGNMFAWTKSTASGMTVSLFQRVFNISQANGRETVAVAAICSKLVNGTWQRSTQSLVLTDAFRDGLYNQYAQQLTIESYQEQGDINKLNSAWYLNLANGQPFPGQLSVITAPYAWDSEDEPTASVTTVLGREVLGRNSFKDTLFTDDGTVTGKLVTVADGQVVMGTAEMTQGLRTNPASRYYGVPVLPWLDVYATQLGF